MTETHVRQDGHHMELGPWRIDLEHGRVKGPTGPSGLTPRAEDLLILLCRHAGEPVSREQIFEHVWTGRVVEDAAISNAVWQIRKGLGENGKQILQTRPKRGYALVIPSATEGVRPQDSRVAAGGEVPPVANPVDGSALVAAHDVAVREPTARETGKGKFRLRMSGLILLSILFVALSAFLIFGGSESSRLNLVPGDVVSVHVDIDGAPPWVESAVLRSVVDAMESRDAEILRFEQRQRRNPFSSAHLEVKISAIPASNEVSANFSFSKGDVHLQERFTGSEQQVSSAISSFLDRHLDRRRVERDPAFDDYVTGRTAELLYDKDRAIQYYRGALAKSPSQVQSILAIAGILQDQGRGRELVQQLASLDDLKDLSPSERCRVDVFLTFRAPEKLRRKPCERAAIIAAGASMKSEDVLRSLQIKRGKPQRPNDWKEAEVAGIIALVSLHEFAQAESSIDAAAAIAREAGWRHAELEIKALRARVAMNSGKFEEFARQRWQSADAMQALGDLDLAHFYRLEAIYGTRIVPGRRAGELRRELIAVADQANARGNVANEVEALRLRLPLERDNPVEWRALMERTQVMMDQAYSPDVAVRESVILIGELRAQRHFEEALDAVARRKHFAEKDPQLRLWQLFIRFGSHFARDELSDAAAAVDALEKEQFDLADGGDLCRYAWLFVEKRDWPRAEPYLRRCLGIGYDRKSQAEEGDAGLVAQSRLHALRGQPDLAWSDLRPRIAALLATEDLDRREAESLTLLARHATGLPTADIALLRRALARTEAIAGLDAAGPGLRFGVHVLRWRLCRREGREGCGPILPDWAPEDRFEARLALEGAGVQARR
jgi:DNA-binding winged helix-turn-helix (wHTH) protein